MSATVQRALGPMEVISVEGVASPTVTKVDGTPSSTVTKVDRSRDWLQLVSRALGKSGLSHKAAAAEMDIDRGLLSAQLTGVPGKHLSWSRMGALPPEFWRELILLVLDFHDITIGTTQKDAEDAAIGRLVREAVGRCR